MATSKAMIYIKLTLCPLSWWSTGAFFMTSSIHLQTAILLKTVPASTSTSDRRVTKPSGRLLDKVAVYLYYKGDRKKRAESCIKKGRYYSKI